MPNETEVVTMGDTVIDEGTQPSPAATEQVEVEIGGQKFKLSPDAAAAVRATQDAATRAAEQTARDLAALKETVAGLAPKQPPARTAAQNDLDYDEVFRDPEGFFTKYGERLANQIVAGVRGEYQKDKGQQAFWDEFYKQNKDLEGHRDYVTFVMQRDMATLSPLKVGEAIKTLATAVKTDLLKLTGGKPLKNDSNGRPVAEGGTERGSEPSNGADDVSEPSQAVNPDSISGIIMARRQARREGKGLKVNAKGAK